MHHLVAAQNGVSRAGLDAQGAAYAPGLVNDGDVARAFQAISGVQGKYRQACDGCQSLHAFLTAWRALVDGSAASDYGLCVRCAVRVAATRALCLRQCSVDALGEQVPVEVWVWRDHPTIVEQHTLLFAAGCFYRCLLCNRSGCEFNLWFGRHFYLWGSCYSR